MKAACRNMANWQLYR